MRWVDGRAWLGKRMTISVSAHIWLEQRKWEIGSEGKSGQTKLRTLYWRPHGAFGRSWAGKWHTGSWGSNWIGGRRWTMTARWERPMPESEKLWWEMMGWGKKGWEDLNSLHGHFLSHLSSGNEKGLKKRREGGERKGERKKEGSFSWVWNLTGGRWKTKTTKSKFKSTHLEQQCCP